MGRNGHDLSRIRLGRERQPDRRPGRRAISTARKSPPWSRRRQASAVQVLEFADRLLLTNHTGQTVTIYGYEGEPYARVLANGTAEQNQHAPATYLNTNFYADVTVPAQRQLERPARLGRHRPHRAVRMARPPHPLDVADPTREGQEQVSKRTLIFDWQRADRGGHPARCHRTASSSGRPRTQRPRPS